MLSNLLNPPVLRDKGRWTGMALFAVAMPFNALALTSAGTVIQGQTLAGYADSDGNIFTTQSNISVVTVNQVYSANIGVDKSKESLSNASTSLAYTLTNSGNGTDTYTLSALNDSGDNGDFNTLAIFHDINNNGVADAGEPEVSSLSLDMGESATLILAVTLPTALTGDTFLATLTATTSNGSVGDLTPNNGADGLAGTVQAVVTVTNNPILEVTNETTLDPIAQTLTQTITVSNVGGRDAHDVLVFSGRTRDDAGAGAWRMADITSITATGLGAAIDGNDIDPTITGYSTTGGISEVALGLDFNGDGDIDDVTEQGLALDLDIAEFPTRQFDAGSNLGGAYGFDNTLAQGSSIQLTIVRSYGTLLNTDGSGSYSPNAGILLPTEAYVTWDTDDDGNNLNEKIAISNTTTDTVPESHGFTFAEAGNDATVDGVVTIDAAEAGDTLSFPYTITNTGNARNTYELSFTDISFPAGTLFTLANGVGGLPLLDSNGNTTPDTGPLDAGTSTVVVVEARLPAGADATTTEMDLTISATPENDSGASLTLGGKLRQISPSTTSFTIGGEFSGFNETPPASGPGSCGTGEAFSDLADAKNVTAKGRFCFNLGAGEFQADVDTAQGGGWVLVMQYIHEGGTDPAKTLISAGADLPITSDAPLGTDGSANSPTWGHGGNAALAQFTGDIETRWHGTSTEHDRTVHFYSTVGDDYLRSGTGSFSGIQTDFEALSSHTANLPAAADSFRSNRGDSAMTHFAFYENGVGYWTVGDSWDGSAPGVWEVDDMAFKNSESTTHRAWVRSTEPATVLSAPVGIASTSRELDPGDSISIDIAFANGGSSAQAYTIDFGGSYLGGGIGDMYPGWSAVLKDAFGNPLTQTPLLSAGDEFKGSIEVTVPENAAQAKTSYTSSSPFNDDGATQIDGNNDGDFDYPIYIGVTSSVSGQTNILLNTFDINEVENLLFDGPRTGYMRSGSSIEFTHTLTNAGNTDEAISFSVANDQNDWTSLIAVDTTGDGTGDYPAELLSPADTYYYTDSAGILQTGAVNSSGELPLPAGAMISVTSRTFIPSAAPDAQTNISTLVATYNSGADSVTLQDQITVSNAQLQLYRSASVDGGCADIASSDLGPDVSFNELTGRVDPGDCVVWQVTANNMGNSPINDVMLSDVVSAFSTYEPNTLRVCVGDAGQAAAANCSFTALNDANDGADEGYYESGTVRFEFGKGAAPLVIGGVMDGGSVVTVRYSVRVE